MHAGRRVALLCIDPWSEPEGFHPFNYAVRRVQAALLAASIEGVEVHLVEAGETDADTLLARLEAIEPDVVGASAYVWSFAIFVEVAERLKRRRPEVTVIFGGPSARPAMFALAPYRERRFAVDALVLGEGEEIFASIIALAARGAGELASIPGLALPAPDGFSRTGPATLVEGLDALASPYRMGLVSAGFSAHLETFRGCPLSCSFCQWGDAAGSSRAFSREYLARELSAIRDLGLTEALLVDAGLNLNLRAFRNLAAAEREVRVLRDVGLHFEVYPSHLTDEHLAFLADIKLRGIGLGLQSYDKEVLRRMERPFDEERFERVARQLHELGGDVTIEIIVGLPGDSPESLARTLDRARELPCNVRAYHCMVLPDALMTRAPPWADMVFDPATLLMRSCAGWSEAALAQAGHRLTALCDEADGWSQGTFWFFPRESRQGFTGPRARARGPALPSVPIAPPAPAVEVLAAALVAKISAIVAAATGDRWTVSAVERQEGVVTLHVSTPSGASIVELAPARAAAPAYRVVGDVAVSYRSTGTPPVPATPDFLQAFDRLSVRAAPLFSRLVHGGAPGGDLRETPPVSLPILR